jgi:hypothetical protein
MAFQCPRCCEWRYASRECRCELRGKVWAPDCGETEADAQDVFSVMTDPDEVLDGWCERAQSDSGGEFFTSKRPQLVAFRDVAGHLHILEIQLEYEPTYHVSKATGADAEAIVKMVRKAEEEAAAAKEASAP